MQKRALSRSISILIPVLAAFLLLLAAPSPAGAQAFVSPLPRIVVPEHPPGIIPMQRSDFSLSGFQTAPLTFEVQVLDATNTPVPDNYFGPNTYFMVDITLANSRGNTVAGAVNSMPTQNGIARFEGIVLRVTPDVYVVTITVRIVFAVDGLGSTFLTLGSTFGGEYMIGVEPTPTPTVTPTVNPYAGTPPVILTQQQAIYNLATALSMTQQPTAFCPPSDPFNCMFPTSTPSSTGTATATGTATPTPTVTPVPVVSPVDGDFTIPLDSRGGSFQNEVSGPSGDTVDIIDFAFGIGAITQTTTVTVTFTCQDNTSAAATVAATGTVVACGRNTSVTVSPVDSVVRIVVTSLASRDQVRTPYSLSISSAR